MILLFDHYWVMNTTIRNVKIPIKTLPPQSSTIQTRSEKDNLSMNCVVCCLQNINSWSVTLWWCNILTLLNLSMVRDTPIRVASRNNVSPGKVSQEIQSLFLTVRASLCVPNNYWTNKQNQPYVAYFLRSLQSLNWLTNSSPYTETEGSQQPANRTYPMQFESINYLHTVYKINFNVILPLCLCLPSGLLPSGLPSTTYAFLTAPEPPTCAAIQFPSIWLIE
jgi:hypothetical protein